MTAVNAVRRRLPMVKIEKRYLFDCPGGEEEAPLPVCSRAAAKSWSIIPVRSPRGKKGCPGLHVTVTPSAISAWTNADNTSFPLRWCVPGAAQQARGCKERREAFRLEFPRSAGDFNYDFTSPRREIGGRTIYRKKAEARGQTRSPTRFGRRARPSVFFFASASMSAQPIRPMRSARRAHDARALLDMTPRAAAGFFEGIPAGLPQRPTYG